MYIGFPPFLLVACGWQSTASSVGWRMAARASRSMPRWPPRVEHEPAVSSLGQVKP
jgi:hypothetical protein